jgi:hypothetical protein
MGNAFETPFFFDVPVNTTVGTEGSKLVLLKITGHGKLRITMNVSILADLRNWTPFVVLKKRNILKDKLHGGIVCMSKCHEKGWMTEIMVEWLRDVWDRDQVLL